MKRIVAFCLSLVLLFSFTLFLNCSAADESDSAPDVITEPLDDVNFTDDLNFASPSFRSPIATYASSDFNISQVDWLSFPKYIQDIVYAETIIKDGEIKIPLVLVRVGSSNYQVWVGYNWFIGYSSQNNRYYISRPVNTSYSSSKYSQVYTATFKISNNAITSDWKDVSWTLKDGASAAYSTTLVSSSTHDYAFYVYGGFVLDYSYQNYASVGLRYSASDSSTAYYLSSKPGIYSSSNPAFLGYPNSLYPSISLDYFTPQTADQKSAETQGGILSQLTALPSKIKGFFTDLSSSISGFFSSLGDRISGFFDDLFTNIKQFFQDLFIPSSQMFEDFKDDFEKWIKGRLGMLYQAPELIVTIFNKLISFNPKTSDYQMTFPKLQAPEVQNGKVIWHDVAEETVVSFDFLENKPFSTLYSFYTAFVWLAFILMVVNLIIKKYNQLFGGHD